MDLDTYEQMGISSGVVGQSANLLKESENAYVLIARDAAMGVDLPTILFCLRSRILSPELRVTVLLRGRPNQLHWKRDTK